MSRQGGGEKGGHLTPLENPPLVSCKSTPLYCPSIDWEMWSRPSSACVYLSIDLSPLNKRQYVRLLLLLPFLNTGKYFWPFLRLFLRIQPWLISMLNTLQLSCWRSRWHQLVQSHNLSLPLSKETHEPFILHRSSHLHATTHSYHREDTQLP